MTGQAGGRMRRVAGALLLLLLSTVVSLAIAEGVVRRYRPLEPPMRFGQVAESFEKTVRETLATGEGGLREGTARPIPFDEVFVADPELLWRFAPNIRLPDDYWPLFGLLSNGQGLREDHEIPVPKPSGEVRILFIGDSCTYGYLLAWDETVAHLTEGLLRERHPRAQIEVVNAGVPAYSLFQGWRFLETEGMRYEPDLVVVNFTWNGAAVWNDQGDMAHYARWKASQPDGPLRHSRLYQLVWGLAYPTAPLVREKRRPRLRPEEFKTLLMEIQNLTLRGGVDLLMLIGGGRLNLREGVDPDERTPLQSELRYFGERIPFGPEGESAYVDAVPIVQALARDLPVEQILHDELHPTAVTNRAIARALADKLDPWLAARLR